MRLNGQHEQAAPPAIARRPVRHASHRGAVGSSPMANAAPRKRGPPLIRLDKHMPRLAPPDGKPGRPAMFSEWGGSENGPADCYPDDRDPVLPDDQAPVAANDRDGGQPADVGTPGPGRAG